LTRWVRKPVHSVAVTGLIGAAGFCFVIVCAVAKGPGRVRCGSDTGVRWHEREACANRLARSTRIAPRPTRHARPRSVDDNVATPRCDPRIIGVNTSRGPGRFGAADRALRCSTRGTALVRDLILETAATILRADRPAGVCSIPIDVKCLIATSYFAQPSVEQTAMLGSSAGSTVQEHRVRATPRDGEADRHLSRGRVYPIIAALAPPPAAVRS
jgi:hypothetical protein